MFIRDNIILATRNFKTRKLRTFLTILGISVGIGTTLFLVSLGYGLQGILLEKIAKSDALLTLDVVSTNPSVIKINKQTLDDFRKIPNVVEVSPLQIVLSQFKFNDVTSNVKLSSVDSNFFKLGGIEFVTGEMYKSSNDKKVILSTGALTSLGIENLEEALEKKVRITLIVSDSNNAATNDKGNQDLLTENKMVSLEEDFVICGIVDDPAESSGYLPNGWADKANVDSYDEVKVKVADQKILDSVRNALIDKNFSVLALTDTVEQANKIFFVIQLVLALFGIVALVVSAIGMFNTMTIALLERTNEIGTMKALGALNREIRALFITESVIIGFLGGVGGIMIGLVTARVANFGFNFLARNMGGQVSEIFYTPIWFVMFILVFSTIIGFITGIYPATRASRLNPLVALRYK